MAHAAVSTTGLTLPSGAAAADRQVALLEFLLGSLDQVESARRVVDWLVENGVTSHTTSFAAKSGGRYVYSSPAPAVRHIMRAEKQPSSRRPPEQEAAEPVGGGPDQGQGPGIADQRAQPRGQQVAAGQPGEREGQRGVEAEEGREPDRHPGR